VAPGLFNYPGTPADTGDSTLLAGTADAAWDLVREHAELRRYRPGEAVLGANDADRALWIVLDGRVEVITGRRLADELGPSSVFGELQFLAGVPAPSQVRAATDATLMRLHLSAFEVLAGKNPVLARHLLFDLARSLALRLQSLRRIVDR
jgi:CRP/FNR family transcriptional regulator, cyclic AMP receptor protein